MGYVPIFVLAFACAGAHAQEPVYAQPGKDVIWVPTPGAMVERMLTLASVTPQDTVVDLGSGDGRIVIAAAKRGARALGIEYNPELVAYSRRAAEREGVAGRAAFVQADIFQSDFSHASVVMMFLTSELILKLQPKLLALRPGTRVVSNTFPAVGWEPDAGAEEPFSKDCDLWCNALLWIVPARVAGTYDSAIGQVMLNQQNQLLTGVLHARGRLLLLEGRVHGEEIRFRADGRDYRARLNGRRLELF